MGQSSMKTYDIIVRQRTKVVVLLLAALVSTVQTHAWRWNIDYWTIAQVGENTAAESGAEGKSALPSTPPLSMSSDSSISSPCRIPKASERRADTIS